MVCSRWKLLQKFRQRQESDKNFWKEPSFFYFAKEMKQMSNEKLSDDKIKHYFQLATAHIAAHLIKKE